MKNLIIFISLIFCIQTGIVFAGNKDWLVREIKHSNQKGVGHSEHGSGFGFGHDREAFVLFRDGKIKGGDTETCEEVPTPSADAVITTYPDAGGSRPSLITRVVEPGIGVVSDGYSDGSTDVFCYNDAGQLEKVTNTETGLKNEFVYASNGDMDLYIQYDNKSIDTYRDGRQVGIIYISGGEILVNRMVWNDTYTTMDYQRGTESTNEESSLYNKYFS